VNSSDFSILYIGDIVGASGREAISRELPALKDELQPDFIIMNAENAAHGFGLTPSIARDLFKLGADVLTGGNHTFDKKEIQEVFREFGDRVLRPANYPDKTPGQGSAIVQARDGTEVGVLNLMGRVFMDPLDCPFQAFDREWEKFSGRCKFLFVDVHAEATSEKYALAYYADGKAAAMVGSHTHVQTADDQIFEKGMGYLSDAGMTGPSDSIIGMKKEIILQRFTQKRPIRMEVAETRGILQGVYYRLSRETGRCLELKRIRKL
jgi:2',3'-cyclic-nucleotide 2'-phosphodiesterase